MYVSRLIIVSLLILVMVVTVAHSLVTGEEFNQVWEEARPAVLGLMDHMYALI